MHRVRAFFVKKTRLLAVLVAAVIVVAGALSVPLAVSVAAGAGGTVVVIDAGHGGIDGGVTGSASGVKESELNLALARVLAEYVEAGGMRAVMTRKSSAGLYRATDSNKKRADMQRRVEIVREAAPVAVVSIHMNTFSSPSRRGAQVFFDAGSEKGRALAELVQDELNRTFNVPDTGREFSALAAEKYLLQNSPAPAVIVECGFLSNPADEANLLDDAYRAEMAHAVFRALAVFVSGGA